MSMSASALTYSGGTSTGLCPRLPLHQRHSPISYTDDNGATGETAYPINYDELYNLKGRLLTLVDATFTDPEQRKAHKDIVWQTLKEWFNGFAQLDGRAWGTIETRSDGSDK